MNDQFDELAKGLAQSVTRRGALKKFGLGLAGIALASLGLANKAQARGFHIHIRRHCKCHEPPSYGCTTQECYDGCVFKCTRCRNC